MHHSRASIAVPVAVLPVVAALLIAAGTGSAHTNAELTLAQPLPTIVRIGQTVTVAGEASGIATGARIVLEGLRVKPWQVLATTRLRRGGHFSIRWRIGHRTEPGPLQLRVAALAGGRTLAATRPVTAGIGPAVVTCAPPVPPAANIPVGDGWIEGGLYIQGGAFPGIDQCESQAYTITATNSSTGAVAATMNVGAGDSYTLVVPTGTYTLNASSGCPGRGDATVTAAHGTTADTYCDVP